IITLLNIAESFKHRNLAVLTESGAAAAVPGVDRDDPGIGGRGVDARGAVTFGFRNLVIGDRTAGAERHVGEVDLRVEPPDLPPAFSIERDNDVVARTGIELVANLDRRHLQTIGIGFVEAEAPGDLEP